MQDSNRQLNALINSTEHHFLQEIHGLRRLRWTAVSLDFVGLVLIEELAQLAD